MCTAIAELDTCPNCKSADDYIYNGFRVVHIPYISADESNPVIIKVKKHGIFCKNCKLYTVIRLPKSLTSIATSLTPLNVRSNKLNVQPMAILISLTF